MNTVFDQQGDLISRRALIEALKERLVGQPSQNVQAKRILHDQVAMAIETVEAAPVVDAEPVRNGEWVGTDFDGYADGNPVYYLWQCSCCHEEYERDGLPPWYNYCPNCGAKMDGGDHP